jgi:hypothetical protein
LDADWRWPTRDTACEADWPIAGETFEPDDWTPAGEDFEGDSCDAGEALDPESWDLDCEAEDGALGGEILDADDSAAGGGGRDWTPAGDDLDAAS